MTPAHPKTGIMLALICLCILGVMPIISNSRPSDFDALGFALFLSLWQSVFAVPLFAAELVSPNRGIFGVSYGRMERWRAIAVALVTGAMFGLSTYLYVLAIEKAGAISAAIAIQAYPLFAVLWETLFLNRRKTPTELTLTALLISALYYLGSGGTGRIEGLSIWFVVALGVPFLWSVAHVIIKEEFGRTPITPAQVTFFRVLISAAMLLIIALAVDPAGIASALFRLDFQMFALTMGFVYYVELIVWFYAVRHIDVSLASSITTPWPALTLVLAVIFLGEDLQLYQIVAFIVVVICIYGLMLAGIRKARAAI